MTYTLGLDLGTTYTAAAVQRNGRVEMVDLGANGPVMPTTVHLREDGELLSGDAAARRGLTDPARTAREFKRRFGDPTPILLGGTPVSTTALATAVIRDVLLVVSGREGEPPAEVALTHPANWGQFKLELLQQAAEAAGLREVELVAEPVAAAVSYAARERIPVGSVVAVYDLGGGTFDVAVLRRTDGGFEVLGEPTGLERLGGVDFDHAVVAHVEAALGDRITGLDRSDSDVARALARLRQDCVSAKEALSADSEVTISVALPDVRADVRLTRAEFESLIAPTLDEPMRAFERAVAGAGVTTDELHSALLVGGSSRVPLVAESVARALGRAVSVDAHPKHAIASGAARIAAERVRATTLPDPRPSDAAPSELVITPADVEDVANGDAGATQATAGRSRRARVAAAAAAAVAALGVGTIGATVWATSDDSGSGSAPPATVAAGGAGTFEDPGSPGTDAAGTSAPPTTTATAPTTTAVTVVPTTTEPVTTEPVTSPPTIPTCSSNSGLCAFITDIAVVDGRYVASYTTEGFVPLIVGEDDGAQPGDHHVHFFFDTTTPENAGMSSPSPGSWVLWGLARGGGQFVFDGLAAADRGGAGRLCVAVATDAHAVLPDAAATGNCVALPA